MDLLNYAIRRLGQTLPVAALVTVLIFMLIKLLPGDPAAAILGDRASEASVRALRNQWGLDRPLWQQYAVYMQNLATGNLGQSLRYRTPVMDLLPRRTAVTFFLVVYSMILSVIIAVSLAVVGELTSGPRPNGLAWDHGRKRLLAADVQDLSARLLDQSSGQQVGRVDLPGRPRWCVYDREGDRFLVNIRDPALVALLSADPFALAGTWPVSAAGPHGLDLDAKGGRAFVACDDGTVEVLDLASGGTVAGCGV